MLHPSYSDLIKVANKDLEAGEKQRVQSRYSIVIATAKRARQLIEAEAEAVKFEGKKPLSVAISEIEKSQVKILSEDTTEL